jgi:hypothetical protein
MEVVIQVCFSLISHRFYRPGTREGLHG